MMAPPPGSTPMMKPSSEPRAIGAAAAFHSSRVASRPPIFVVMTSGSSVCSTLASTSPMQAHGDQDEVESLAELENAVGEARRALDRIESDAAEEQPDDGHHLAFSDPAATE